MKIFEKIAAFFRGNNSEKGKNLQTGFIKSFNRAKGYGFIVVKESNTRVFVHISEIKERFRVGDQVSFQLGTNEKGYVAKEVVRIQKNKS